jgi:hypothetical protein
MHDQFALALGSVLAGVYMRWSGKFYYMTLASALLPVLSNALLASWSDSSSTFHMWLDIVPAGLGMSALVTSTLIVSIGPLSLDSGCTVHESAGSQALIADVDREHVAVATGSESNKA